MYSVLFHCTFCVLAKQHWRYHSSMLKKCCCHSQKLWPFATGLLSTMTSSEVFRCSWCGMVGAWWSLDWCQHPWGRWIWTSMASSSPWAAQNAAWWFDWWGKRIHSRMREWLDHIRVSIGSLCTCKVVFNMIVLFRKPGHPSRTGGGRTCQKNTKLISWDYCPLQSQTLAKTEVRVLRM